MIPCRMLTFRNGLWQSQLHWTGNFLFYIFFLYIHIYITYIYYILYTCIYINRPIYVYMYIFLLYFFNSFFFFFFFGGGGGQIRQGWIFNI